jgi:BirA family biotin operon repressor/biotin-[acetyl-CoA-carboxylase] ligase
MLDDDLDIAALVDQRLVRRCDVFATLDSTNTFLLDRVRTNTFCVDNLPWLVVADQQTAGRGQRANRWWSASGALTLSLLIDISATWPQVCSDGTLAIAMAEATAQAASQFTGLHFRPGSSPLAAPERGLWVKPPNDVYAGPRKIAGVLIETLAAGDGSRLAVIGVGLNVNNRTAAAPPQLADRVTSVADIVGGNVPRCQVLVKLIEAMHASPLRLLQWATSD